MTASAKPNSPVLSRHASRTWSDLQADESGFMTMTHLVCVLFFALTAVWLLNIGRQTTDAPHRQGAADAAAAAAALWVEHGLNELSALNHVMGETTSFIMLHESLVGPLPPRGSPEDIPVDMRLAAAAATLMSEGYPCPAYPIVGQPIVVRGAIGRAKRRLKERLADLYQGTVSVDPEGTSAEDGEAAAVPDEMTLAKEYLWLTQLEVKTLALSSEVLSLERKHLPRLDRQARQLVDDTPLVAAAAAESLVRRYNLAGGVVPFDLPVQRDPLARSKGVPRFPAALYADWSPLKNSSASLTLSADEAVTKTQLARAAWPWLLHHRDPVRDRMRRMAPLSGAPRYFDQHAFQAGVNVCRRLARDRNIALYVLQEATPLAKGHERWGAEPQHADRVFAVIGWAATPRQNLEGEPAVFRNSHPEGRVSLAQGLVYSANPQEPHRDGSSSRQPRVGWDTLAWTNGAGKEPHEMARHIPRSASFPRIGVNWQSLVVPVGPAGLAKARGAGSLPGGVQQMLTRLDPAYPRPLQTH